MTANIRDFEVTVTVVRKMYVRANTEFDAELEGLVSIPNSLEATDYNISVRELPSDPPTVTPDWFVCETLDMKPSRAVCARTEEDCAALLGIPYERLPELAVGFDCKPEFHSFGTTAAKRHPLKVVTERGGQWFLPDGSLIP